MFIVNIVNDESLGNPNPIYVGNKEDCYKIETILNEDHFYDACYAEVVELPKTGSNQEYLQKCLNEDIVYGT